jgi:glycerol-3-phosphate acyltransferase PlsY
MLIAKIISSLLIGYVIGSIPVGVILTKLVKKKNILEMGVKHPGGANVFRELGPAYGIATGLLDAAKGSVTLAIVLLLLDFPEHTVLSGALGAFAGHNWSLFLKFRGGSGVSIIMGIYAFCEPGILGINLGIYLLFLWLWYLKIKPFYRYHMYNWQSVFCITPFVVYIVGPSWIMSYTGLSFHTMLILSIALALAGLIKQIQTYGIMYLFKPTELDSKYTNALREKAALRKKQKEHVDNTKKS